MCIAWVSDQYVYIYTYIYIYIYIIGSSYTFLQPLILIRSNGKKDTIFHVINILKFNYITAPAINVHHLFFFLERIYITLLFIFFINIMHLLSLIHIFHGLGHKTSKGTEHTKPTKFVEVVFLKNKILWRWFLVLKSPFGKRFLVTLLFCGNRFG